MQTNQNQNRVVAELSEARRSLVILQQKKVVLDRRKHELERLRATAKSVTESKGASEAQLALAAKKREEQKVTEEKRILRQEEEEVIAAERKLEQAKMSEAKTSAILRESNQKAQNTETSAKAIRDERLKLEQNIRDRERTLEQLESDKRSTPHGDEARLQSVVREIERVHNEVETDKAKLANFKLESDKLTAEVEELHRKDIETEREMHDLQRRIDQMTSDLGKKQAERMQIKQSQISKEETVREKENNLTLLKVELQKDERAHAQLLIEREAESKSVEQKKAHYAEVIKATEEMRKELERKRTEAGQLAIKEGAIGRANTTEIRETKERDAELVKQIQTLELSLKKNKNDVRFHKTALQEAENRLVLRDRELEERKKSLDQGQKHIQDYERQIALLESESNTHAAEINRLEAKISTLSRTVH